MLNAAGVWPACRLETNLFCWARQSGVVGRQHASRIGFSVATITSSEVVDFYLLCGVCPDCCVVLCWFCRQFSRTLTLDHTVTRIGLLSIIKYQV